MLSSQRMRLRKIGLLIVLIVFVAGNVQAEDLKIGVVDMQRALTSSKLGSEAQEKYQQEVKKAQAELDKKKEQFEQMKKSFTNQRDSLNEKARSQKEEEILSFKKEVERSLEDAEQGLRRKNAQLVSELVKKLRKIVQEIGKDEDYTIVLETQSPAVLYANKAIDITDKAVAAFNKQSE